MVAMFGILLARRLWPALVLVIATGPPAAAGQDTYNLKITTDASPDVSDLGSFVSSTTSAWPANRDKVWALWYWSHILKRQTWPMTLHGFEVTDPIRNFNDYGFTQCSGITGINQVLYEQLGLRHQFWDICNHTVSQVEYDGSFHMIDSALSNLVTTDDGSRLASLQEVVDDHARLLRSRSLFATSPLGFLTGTDAARNLANTTLPSGDTLAGVESAFCADGLKYRDYYYNWDAGHRYILNLKRDQTYTRFYNKLGDKPEYFVPGEDADRPDPNVTIDPETANNFGVRANGRWIFTPSLAPGVFDRAMYSSANISADFGGLTPATANQPGIAVYKVQSANVITSQTIVATFGRTESQARAQISVSINHGQRWQLVGELGADLGDEVPLNIALRDDVNGAYEVLIRIQMTPSRTTRSIVLSSLAIETITQVNAKALPHLTVGRNRISIDAGEQADTMVLWPELRGDRWQNDVYDSQNIASQSINVPTNYTAVVFPARADQDAYLTYRMDAPSDITQLMYGGRLSNFYPGSYIDFLHSFDRGATWITSYHFDSTEAPWDVIHYETVTGVPQGTRSVLFKFLIHTTSVEMRPTGLYSARMEAAYQPLAGGGAPIDVTFSWAEVQRDHTLVERTHKAVVTSFPFAYDLNVGGVDHPLVRSLRVNLQASGDGTSYGYSDGRDAGGEKYLYRWRTDGANLAQGRPYTMSRPAEDFQGSVGPENTNILTDGVVGAPEAGGLAYLWGQCWYPEGGDVDITVDLGGQPTVGAFRSHFFGWPDWDALKGEVQDRVEVFTSVDGAAMQSRGTLEMDVRRKDVPINYMLMDSERATAWNYELRLDTPVVARFVKYHVTPARIICTSELQVLDQVTYTPFDIRIAPPPILSTPPAAPPSPPPPPSPAYGGIPGAVPGRIEAENFDEGGQGVAYFDTSAGNVYGAYRATDVDIETTLDVDGGFDVAKTKAGEWLQYTVNVAAASSSIAIRYIPRPFDACCGTAESRPWSSRRGVPT